MSAFKFKKVIGIIFVGLFLFSFYSIPKKAEAATLPMNLTVTYVQDVTVGVTLFVTDPDNILTINNATMRVRIYDALPLYSAGNWIANQQYNADHMIRNTPITFSSVSEFIQDGVGLNYNNITMGQGGREFLANTDYYVLALTIIGNTSYQSALIHFKTSINSATPGQIFGPQIGHAVIPAGNQSGDTFQSIDSSTNILGAGDWAPVTNETTGEVGDTIYKTENLCKNANPGKKCVQVYKLLQPLPRGDGTDFKTFNTSQKDAFGNYLNILIKIFIGICAVLAMIMIVIGGIEYMTSELISGKAEGKERITNAIFGLLLALGSYAILNTINPQLLDVSLSGLKSAQVQTQTQEEPPEQPGSPTANCVGGLVEIDSFLGSEFIKSNSVGDQKICADLKPAILAFKTAMESRNNNWYITAGIAPGHKSLCHNENNLKSGNCVDIGIKVKGNYGSTAPNANPHWGKICEALNTINGIKYLNEATNSTNNPNNTACGTFKEYAHASGAHVHMYKIHETTYTVTMKLN